MLLRAVFGSLALIFTFAKMPVTSFVIALNLWAAHELSGLNLFFFALLKEPKQENCVFPHLKTF
jgi:Na+-transporting NADH:ubiquinone oxidoreductase subunit NqrB